MGGPWTGRWWQLGVTTHEPTPKPTTSPGSWQLLCCWCSLAGVTGQDDEREYMVNLGLVSNRGVNSRPTPYHDKVRTALSQVRPKSTYRIAHYYTLHVVAC